MPYIRERNGNFLITWKNGRQSLSKTFRTKEEAIIWHSQMSLAHKKGDSDVSLSKVRFADIAQRYLREVTPIKKSALNEAIIIKRLLTEHWVNMKLAQVTSGHLGEFRDQRLKKIKPATFKREWHCIRSIANYARKMGESVNLDLFEGIRLPTVYARKIERITPQMEMRLLDFAYAAGGRAKYLVPFINLALATAMRRGELCSLEWSEVDMDRRHIYVAAVKAKSGKARTIPMTQRAYEALLALQDLQRGSKVVPATGNAVRCAFNRIRKLAGLEHIRIHDCRHESISRFHEAGLTLPEIQSISGHADLEMLAHYSHASTNNLVAKLGGVK